MCNFVCLFLIKKNKNVTLKIKQKHLKTLKIFKTLKKNFLNLKIKKNIRKMFVKLLFNK